VIYGSKMITQCCPAVSNTDKPTPPAGEISKLTMKVEVKTQFQYSDEPLPNNTVTFTGYLGVVYPVSEYDWSSRVERVLAGRLVYFADKTSYSANGTTKFEITWTRTADSSNSGLGGKYLRPGTDKVIAQGLSWVSTIVNFGSPTAIASYDTFQESEYLPVGSLNTLCEQYGPDRYMNTLSKGDNIDRSASFPSAGNQSISWIGIANSDQPGMSLAQTAAGSALGPWVISVQAGTVSFTDKNNNTTSYSGTIASVVSAINSWPSSGGKYFDAGTAKSTSEAKTSDLKNYTSSPVITGLVGGFYCVLYLPIVSVGDVLTPSSTDVRFGNNIGSRTLLFDPNKFPDNEAGFNSFIKSTFYPKLDDFYDTGGGLSALPAFFQSYEFDGFSNISSYYWSLTSGTSVKTKNVIVDDRTRGFSTYTLVSATCEGRRESIISFCDCGTPESNCNVFSGNAGFPCGGGTYPNCQNPDEPPYPCACYCENLSSEVIFEPEFELIATQTMKGSLVVS